MDAPPNDRTMETILELIAQGQFTEAYALCLPLAETGSLDAQLQLGWMLHTGNGVPKDLKQAQYWYERATRSNSPRAEFYLASVFWNSREFDKAREWCERAASHGFTPAVYHLGRMYRHGVGIAMDEERGLRYLDQAARDGHLLARRDIARDMLKGNRGILRIPVGLLALCRLFWPTYKTALTNPLDDSLFRL
jgi:TPR repeat protein